MVNPIYDNNIVVAVVSNKQFNWYVSNKFFWILDLTKLNSDEQKNYFNVANAKSIRENLNTITNENLNEFLNRLEQYRVSTNQLKMIKSQKDISLEDITPALLVDFDNCVLYSQFPEYLSFEDYVPKNWKADFEDFTQFVPVSERYWK